jgi:hypothetical protein
MPGRHQFSRLKALASPLRLIDRFTLDFIPETRTGAHLRLVADALFRDELAGARGRRAAGPQHRSASRSGQCAGGHGVTFYSLGRLMGC